MDTLNQTQKTKGKKMVKDIYKWWETIREAGIVKYDDETYYVENPKFWRYTPEDLLKANNVHDFKQLESDWKDIKEEYINAKKLLKDEKQNTKKKTTKKSSKQTSKKTTKKSDKKIGKKSDKKSSKKTVKKKRCPNGTRRNKKTGKCEKKES